MSGERLFYVVGHGVDEVLQTHLEALSRRFFALPVEEKMAIRMALGGPAGGATSPWEVS
ncbi:2-oxoglutarate and iron-dependent oxygenase domain-containing protein [Cystobacter fuscus]